MQSKPDNTASAAPAVTDAAVYRLMENIWRQIGRPDLLYDPRAKTEYRFNGVDMRTALEAASSSPRQNDGAGEPVAWVLTRETDPTYPRAYGDEDTARRVLASVNVGPLPVLHSVPASPQPTGLQAEVDRLTQSRDGYAKDAAARAEECDRLRAQLSKATSPEYLTGALEKIGVVDAEWKARAEAAEAREADTRAKALEEAAQALDNKRHSRPDTPQLMTWNSALESGAAAIRALSAKGGEA